MPRYKTPGEPDTTGGASDDPAAASPDPPSPDAPAIALALLAHFDAHRRAMPWRETADPYAIWVSEVMLQQTRVDTVIPYWERWIERFPTVSALADADLDDVLKLWEGLGYYSRARNLHSAARLVRERYDGAVPGDPSALRELPGVGEYTAGAVASIAFGVPTPAVDGNVRRVLARLDDMESPTAGELRHRAAELVPHDRPGDFNQALMELGATICTPRTPDCPACPVAEWCRARHLGVQELRPLPVARRAIPEERVRTLVLVRADGAMLLVRRPLDGLLGGLWEFPAEGDVPSGAALPGEAGVDEVAVDEVAGDEVAGDEVAGDAVAVELDPVAHTFSHKRVIYEPLMVRLPVRPRSGWTRDAAHVGLPDGSPGGSPDVAWVAPDALEDYAMPVAQRKIAAASARVQTKLEIRGGAGARDPTPRARRPAPPQIVSP